MSQPKKSEPCGDVSHISLPAIVTFAGHGMLTVGSAFYLFDKDGSTYHYGCWIRDDRHSYKFRHENFTLSYMNNNADYALAGCKSYADYDKQLQIPLNFYEGNYSVPRDAIFAVMVQNEKVIELAGHAMLFGRVINTMGSLEGHDVFVNAYPRKKNQYIKASLK